MFCHGRRLSQHKKIWLDLRKFLKKNGSTLVGEKVLIHTGIDTEKKIIYMK